jgi:thymidine phosphorylase
LAMLDATISSGKALEKFEQLVAAQGGDRAVVRNTALLPKAPHRSEFVAERGGFVQSVDPRAVGYGVIALGGGRRNMEEKIDPSVGFVITAKPGDRVTKGETLATIHARSRKDLKAGNDILGAAIVISDSTPEWLPLVSHRITAGGVEDLLRPAKRRRKRA